MLMLQWSAEWELQTHTKEACWRSGAVASPDSIDQFCSPALTHEQKVRNWLLEREPRISRTKSKCWWWWSKVFLREWKKKLLPQLMAIKHFSCLFSSCWTFLFIHIDRWCAVMFALSRIRDLYCAHCIMFSSIIERENWVTFEIQIMIPERIISPAIDHHQGKVFEWILCVERPIYTKFLLCNFSFSTAELFSRASRECEQTNEINNIRTGNQIKSPLQIKISRLW